MNVDAAGDVYHRYHAGFVVDSVDDPVGTATRKHVVHRRKQPLPDPVRPALGAGDERAGSRRNGFRETLAQCTADG